MKSDLCRLINEKCFLINAIRSKSIQREEGNDLLYLFLLVPFNNKSKQKDILVQEKEGGKRGGGDLREYKVRSCFSELLTYQ